MWHLVQRHKKSLLLITCIIASRLVLAFTLKVNSDEPQHLHIVWAWLQGLVPYRDVFDNHTPLFHLINVPFLYFFGERADIVILMRLMVLPWYFLSLWCIYRIGCLLFSRHIAIWTLLLTAFFPAFCVPMTEFRTDAAWAACWLLTVLVAVDGQVTIRRLFCVGFLAGITIAISMKTSLLLATFLAASAVVLIMQKKSLWNRDSLNRGLAAVLGFMVIPGALVIFFVVEGAWREMFYGVFTHNIVSNLGRWEDAQLRFWLFPLSLPILIALANRLVCHSKDRQQGAKRAVLFLAAFFYIFVLHAYWPLVTRQDLLPFAPFAMLYFVAALLSIPQKNILFTASKFFGGVLAIEVLLLMGRFLPAKERAATYTQELAKILALTNPDDYVMDAKGAAIFRNRPVYPVLENITLKRMRLGLMADDIPARLIATRTPVTMFNRLFGNTLQFAKDNYVPIAGNIAVLGKILEHPSSEREYEFTIAIPSRYAVTTEHGQFMGEVDGVPYTGSRYLSAGTHRLYIHQGGGRVAVFWAQALERGFSPYTITK